MCCWPRSFLLHYSIFTRYHLWLSNFKSIDWGTCLIWHITNLMPINRFKSNLWFIFYLVSIDWSLLETLSKFISINRFRILLPLISFIDFFTFWLFWSILFFICCSVTSIWIRADRFVGWLWFKAWHIECGAEIKFILVILNNKSTAIVISYRNDKNLRKIKRESGETYKNYLKQW